MITYCIIFGALMIKAKSKIECPICHKSLNVTILPYNTSNYGEIIITVIFCLSCGYRDVSITSSKSSNPKRIIFKIKDRKDLSVRIIKSETCTISIPELDIAIKPCSKSQIMVTNVEGLLNWIKGLILEAEIILEPNENKLKCLEIIKKIDDVINGKHGLTIILEDINGNSILLSDKAKVESY